MRDDDREPFFRLDDFLLAAWIAVTAALWINGSI
jgi:hypothetical protein